MAAVCAIAFFVWKFKSIQMNNEAGCDDVRNQIKIFLGSAKTSVPCQTSKQYMSLKYFHASILGLGLTRGHLYSPAVPLLPLTVQKKKKFIGRAIQSSVCPNIPTINQLWLL